MPRARSVATPLAALLRAWPRQELAAELGVSRTRLARWYTAGRSHEPIPEGHLSALAALLDLPVVVLREAADATTWMSHS